MGNRNKNKTKLNKEYPIVGKILVSAIKSVSKFFFVRCDARNIRCKVQNALRHNRQHIEEIEDQLNNLGLRMDDYAKYIASNYNRICLGNKPCSLVLVVKNDGLNHMAAICLTYYAEEDFWMITSTRAIRSKDLDKMTIVWERK